jgi:hypothetical protein
VDPKAATVLSQYGARKILADLANVPEPEKPPDGDDGYVDLANLPKTEKLPDDDDQYGRLAMRYAQEFVDRYGPLAPGPPEYSVQQVLSAASGVRLAWAARTQREMERVNNFLDSVFDPVTGGVPFEFGLPNVWDENWVPAIRSNFMTGRWEPKPRHLMDALALELMRSRTMLHRCERKECRRYFVKEFSRDRYCSMLCSETMRKRGQLEWVRNKRKKKSQKVKR